MSSSSQQDQRYNGWTNYATWGVALVLDNDEGSYTYVREHVAEIIASASSHDNVISGIWTAQEAAKFETADFLKDYTEELCGLDGNPDGFESIPEPTMMARQVMQAGLADVDWDEIAGNIVAES